ncbi:hypothetical protein [Agaribacterium sp. ZY112]|uniref:hypothetical protein n=1 Tax=Agaribacterium sp. ZY112 TaxID=3233574 RepID=UPI003524FD4F
MSRVLIVSANEVESEQLKKSVVGSELCIDVLHSEAELAVYLSMNSPDFIVLGQSIAMQDVNLDSVSSIAKGTPIFNTFNCSAIAKDCDEAASSKPQRFFSEQSSSWLLPLLLLLTSVLLVVDMVNDAYQSRLQLARLDAQHEQLLIQHDGTQRSLALVATGVVDAKVTALKLCEHKSKAHE